MAEDGGSDLLQPLAELGGCGVLDEPLGDDLGVMRMVARER